ncbi:MAG: hypothetical protein FJY56_19250 [Betaproteobacteria bacterium]|nr:hypothetical protein [Betaproteobacteria bacterium]
MTNVAIVGAGPIGRATAAYLAHHNIAVSLWSPSGKSTRALAIGGGRGRLAYEGALQGEAEVGVLAHENALGAFDVVLLAIPGHAYPAVLPRVAPHLHGRQLVIVSGALSLAPLWLYERAGVAGIGRWSHHGAPRSPPRAIVATTAGRRKC